MDEMRKCIECNETRNLSKFEKNRKVCIRCRGRKHNSTSCIKKNRSCNHNFRLIWDKATFVEKINHAKKMFDDHVIKQSGCWGWNGVLHRGYANITFDRKVISAHRLSWLLHYGPIMNNAWVLHKCDNKMCTNPDHLFLGNAKINFEDMISKGRGSEHLKNKGSLCSWAKLNEEKVKEIKVLLSQGLSQPKIAQKYNVSRGTICDIARGVNWKHVTI